MKRFFPLFILTLLLSTPAFAQARGTYIVKDSVYFTMDDGIQSPEEMIEEAEYVQGVCSRDPYHTQYFDCECIAAEFLQIRETAGPMKPQYEILRELTKGNNAKCANTVGIAGDTYNYCTEYSATRRELETAEENESYCTCAANKAASDFTRSPRLSISHIRNIKVNAMSYCRNPDNRAIVARQAVRTPTPQ